MKKAFNSLFMGVLLAMLPAWGAIESQSESHFLLDRPEPEVYEVQIQRIEVPAAADNSIIDTQAPPEGETHEVIFYEDPDIPNGVEMLAVTYGAEFNICPEFLEAIAFYESTYGTNIENGSCIGLMQVNLSCKEQQERMALYGYTDADMWNDAPSMHVAADYLADLFEEYKDPAEVLMRYNGDRTGLKKFKKSGKISEYAQKILTLSEELEVKHGKK